MEELRDLVAGHQALSADERHIVGEVFNAGKRQIREVLVPRTEVEFLAADTPLADAIQTVAGEPYSRFPVYQQSYDDVIGWPRRASACWTCGPSWGPGYGCWPPGKLTRTTRTTRCRWRLRSRARRPGGRSVPMIMRRC